MNLCTNIYVDIQIQQTCAYAPMSSCAAHTFSNMCIRFMRTGVDHLYMLCACSDRSCVFALLYLFIKLLLCIHTYLTAARETLLP